MPDGWNNVRKVDVYRITPKGCVLREQDISLRGTDLVLSLGKEESVSIVPSGARLSGRASRFGTPRASKQ
jgi:hypothetical protein